MAQSVPADDGGPPVRVVSVQELEQHVREVVRAVQETGATVDIVEGGRVVARMSPSENALAPDAARRRVDAWVAATESFAQEVARRWPSDMTAVDAVNAQRRDP